MVVAQSVKEDDHDHDHDTAAREKYGVIHTTRPTKRGAQSSSNAIVVDICFLAPDLRARTSTTSLLISTSGKRSFSTLVTSSKNRLNPPPPESAIYSNDKSPMMDEERRGEERRWMRDAKKVRSRQRYTIPKIMGGQRPAQIGLRVRRKKRCGEGDRGFGHMSIRQTSANICDIVQIGCPKTRL